MANTNDLQHTFDTFLRRLRIIHLALMAGLVFLGFLAYSLQRSPLADFPVGNQVLVYLVPVTALAGYFGGIAVFRKLMGSLDKAKDLHLKLMRYQSASLLQYACLEAPALLAFFAYIQQGYLLYAAIGAFLVTYLYTMRPTRKKLLEQLPLTGNEHARLNPTP